MPNLLRPKINVGPDGPIAWLQAGQKYGRNDSGTFRNISYRGPRAEVEALVTQLAQGGWSYTVTLEAGGLASIEGSSGTSGSGNDPEVPENVWELDPNEVEKNILEADFPNGTIGQVSKANKAVIADALQRPGDYLKSSPAFASDGTSAAANSLYLLMLAQVQSFPVEASIIRHTQLVSSTYAVQVSYANCNRIISSASMVSVEGVPGNLLYAVPSAPSVTQYIETAGDLQYGWRKIRPNITRLSQSKWRTVQNWQFGLWVVKLYGNVI